MTVKKIVMSECEVCGGNVEVVGNTTKHYHNLDKDKIDQLQKQLVESESCADWYKTLAVEYSKTIDQMVEGRLKLLKQLDQRDEILKEFLSTKEDPYAWVSEMRGTVEAVLGGCVDD